MPTVAKSTGSLSKLGDLSTFEVSTSAIPYDTADSSGAVPTFSATFVDGTDTEYLIGEKLTLSAPSIDSYSGEIVSHTKSATTNRYSLDANTLLARLNIDLRAYPLSDYAGESTAWIPLYGLEYWTQQCGLFYTDVPGDVLFYQSQYGHFGAYCKGITRPVRSQRPGASADRSVPVVFGDRVAVSFGRNSTSTVKMPVVDSSNLVANYLPVIIPGTGSTDQMVFGVNVFLDGTDRRGTVTWHFQTASGQKVSLRLEADANNGFTVYSSEDNITYTSRGNIPAAKGGEYTALIGVTQASSTTTTFALRVMNPFGTQIGNVTTTVATTFQGSLAMYQITYKGEDVGSGNAMIYSNSFISLMKSLPSTQFPVLKAFTRGPKTASFLVGFSGNVWEHVKQYCSIYHLDVSYKQGKLTVEPRQRDIKVGVSLSELNTTTQAREQARFVEVVNQQHKPTGPSPVVLWKADSVYQVAVGEVQEVIVQTKHSILETTQPVCVSGITPFPYTAGVGQYVVTGSDGYIVSPTFWADQGGKITTETTENEGEIKITIKGPDFDSTRAPYRISEGDAGRPALYVSGLGVLADPKTLKVGTGNNKAAKDVGTTLDSPFIGDAKLAYDAAARASREFTVPSIATNIGEPLLYDEASTLGAFPAGALAKSDGNIMRVVNATQNYSSMSGSAVQHNTIYQLNRSFGSYSNTLARTNLVLNPRAVTSTGWSYQSGTSETSTQTLETGAGPNGLNNFIRRTITAAKTGGNSGPFRNETAATGLTGDTVTGSLWVRCSVALQIQLTVTCRIGVGSTAAGSGTTGFVSIAANTWTRLSATAVATADYGNVQVWAILTSGNVVPLGGTIDATQMLIEKSATLGDFFDGNTPNTVGLSNAWSGAANASVSTQSVLTGSIGHMNAFYAGKTIGQVNIKPLKKVN